MDIQEIKRRFDLLKWQTMNATAYCQNLPKN